MADVQIYVAKYSKLTVTSAGESANVPVEVPAGKRCLGGRSAIAIAFGCDTLLRWSGLPTGVAGTLRVTAALDSRCGHRVAVCSAGTRVAMGVWDILFATPGEVFEFPLSVAQMALAGDEGLALQLLEEVPPLFVVAPGLHAPDSVLPQVCVGDREPATDDQFLQRFCSVASLQPCDWMAICVLDGLRDWAQRGDQRAATALTEQLAIYFPSDGRFVHEDVRSQIIDDRASGEENHGPLAVLALQSMGADGRHPALELTAQAFAVQNNPAIAAVGHHQLAAETAYSVAYPMMAMAQLAEYAFLRPLAVQQLRVLRDHLTAADDLHLRYHLITKAHSFSNWSRGVAWYAIGLVRTVALLPTADRPADLMAEIERLAQWLGRHQLADGSWPCFIKEQTIRPDNSGTAGIAAAIALAVRHGMIGVEYRHIAHQARVWLRQQLTSDGWLRGVAQSNKRETHAIDIQRMPYRIIGGWGMGMYAQLLAALAEDS